MVAGVHRLCFSFLSFLRHVLKYDTCSCQGRQAGGMCGDRHVSIQMLMAELLHVISLQATVPMS